MSDNNGKFHEAEAVNRPHYKRFKLQGKNKFLAIAYDNTEVVTSSGIIVPDRDCSQDVPTTGRVVALSPEWDGVNYPDVKVGANIQVVMNSWYTWTRLGQVYASGDAEGIIAVYGWDGDGEAEIEADKKRADAETRAAIEKEQQAAVERMMSRPASEPLLPLIRIR